MPSRCSRKRALFHARRSGDCNARRSASVFAGFMVVHGANGSVSARDVADGIAEAGFIVERAQVSLDHPIKTLGVHKVKITLHPEVSLNVKVNVAQSADEAALGKTPARGQ